MSAPFVANISSAKAFLKDRRRWYFEWVLNRVPRRGQKALTFGKILHVAFETHFKTGMPMADAIDATAASWQEYIGTEGPDTPEERQEIEEAIAELLSYREPLSMWTDTYPVEQTLEVEEAFEYPVEGTNIIVRGRPDRVAVVWGKVFHIQNRSLAAGKNIGLYTDLMRRDMHENVYAWALQQKYPDIPYGGTIFNLLRKLKYRGKATKASPDGPILHDLPEMMGQYMMVTAKKQQQFAVSELVWVAEEMQRVIDEADRGRLPASSRDMDGGFFGNKKDHYFDVLHEGDLTLLQDNTIFKDREDMYADERTEVA